MIGRHDPAVDDRLAILICEGPCNPQILDVDLDARTAGKQKDSRDPVGGERLWQAQRALSYRAHTLAGTVATCTVCNWHRRYGREL